MDQFITGNIWKAVNKLLKKKKNKIACIAYVTSDNLKLSKGDILICDSSKNAIKFGETSPKTLATYFKRGVKIYCNQNLHSKFLLTPEFLVIGSANLSKNSAERLIESAIITDNSTLISQATAFSNILKEESISVKEETIKELLKIQVLNRPFKPSLKSKVRNITFGMNNWFVSVSQIGERTYKIIKETVEDTMSSISEVVNIKEDDIRFIRLTEETKFAEKAKEGDQIILRFFNNKKTKSYVYPPSTILKKEVYNGCTYIYHDCRNPNKKISWNKFKRILTQNDFQNHFNVRTKSITETEFKKFKRFF